MNEHVASPDEQAFRSHLRLPPYLAGAEAGRWLLLQLQWPIAFIAVHAAARENSPDAFVLRFDLDGYPQIAPTAGPWDFFTGGLLTEAGRPKGERVGLAFRTNWESGRALYIPCDRVALTSHTNWPTQYPTWTWDSSKQISFYLRLVFQLLNDPDYTGV